MTLTVPGQKLDVEELLEQLVQLDSRNPDLSPDSAGEQPLADFVAHLLESFGVQTSMLPALPGRSNLLGVLEGRDSEATVIFEVHLDTVPASEKTREVRRDGRLLFGRGSSDPKGSLAAMLSATKMLADAPGPRPAVLLVGVCDEEYLMRGSAELAKTLPPADAVVIGEPTSLIPARAHNGFMRFTITVHGRAAHSSRAELGVNAITEGARLISALDSAIGHRLRTQPHPLTGPASLSPTVAQGGGAANIIPDRFTIWFDRRLSPGETPAGALAEIDAELTVLRSDRGIDARRSEPTIALAALDSPADSIAVRAAEQAATSVLGSPTAAIGVTYSTDACRFADRLDLPCIILGPGSIEQAHTDEEWIDLDQVVAAEQLYFELAMNVHALVHAKRESGADDGH